MTRQDALVLLIASLAAAPATAWSLHETFHGRHAERSVAASAPQTALPYVGEVRSVNVSKGKITLRHRPLTELGMTAMTMEYFVEDARLLDGLKPRDRVRFAAEARHGAFVITGIEKAP